ncbi:helix-turn-helix transcriptional regulator [Burkholderiaceae bacterium DAT-1]|nr:helix-turn-helix transcriptional regulator [Burkholderiaceae bacterium DAT-1]
MARFQHHETLPPDALMPVTSKAVDYSGEDETPRHQHDWGQFLYAVQGVMVVCTDAGQWIVPPTRGVYLPAGTPHWVRYMGPVQIRTLYIHPQSHPDLPMMLRAIEITPLLRELILAAMQIYDRYTLDSREGRVMLLLLDELTQMPALQLHLPHPADPRLARLCKDLLAQLDEPHALSFWADQFGMDERTIQRWFHRETGMTFGAWRQQARILKAVELLGQGEKVVDVALALGYDSPSAFTTMFKRHLGCTPSAYFG